MATMKELLSLMIDRINGKPGNWEELTGKPFGLTMGWEIIVEQPDIIGSGYSQEPYSAFVALTDVALEQGETYKVTINDDDWQVKAFVLPEDTNVYLGDASDRLEEMPFHIYSTEDKTICIIWQITPEEYEMGAPMANITISKGYEAVDTLGYEFMPLDYPAVLKEYVEIMPKAVIRFEETGLNGSVYSNSTIINEGLLSEDKAYRITFNGEKYICQSQVWRGSAFLGNLEILTGTDGNDLPFAILGNMLNWKVELGEEVNLQIEEINNIIRPIDKKFIPDGVGGGVRSVNNTMPDENGNVEILLPEIPELTWDNIEDKPFGTKTEIEYTEVFSCENRRVGTIYDIPQNTYGLALSHQLIVGKEYKVELNGVVAYDTAKVEDDIVYIGNWDTAGLVSSDMPFYIYNAAEDSICVGYSKELGDRLNMKLYIGQRKEIVQPLDYKYMPDGYPKVEKKMVEIVPEQSVTPTVYNEEAEKYEAPIVFSNGIDGSAEAFERYDKTMYFKINGEIYRFRDYGSSGSNGVPGDATFESEYVDVEIDDFICKFVYYPETGQGKISTTNNETITVEVYEIIETVTPVGGKFLNDVYLVITDNFGRLSCNKTYEQIRDMYDNNENLFLFSKYRKYEFDSDYNLSISVKCVSNITENYEHSTFNFKFDDVEFAITTDNQILEGGAPQ